MPMNAIALIQETRRGAAYKDGQASNSKAHDPKDRCQLWDSNLFDLDPAPEPQRQSGPVPQGT